MLRVPNISDELAVFYNLLNQGDLDGARKILTPLLALKKNNIQIAYGCLLVNEGKLREAEAVYEKIPGIAAKLLIAAIYADYLEDQAELAKQKYSEIQKLFPNDPRAFLCYALLLHRENNFEDSLSTLNAGLEITKDNNYRAKAYHSLSIAYTELGIIATAKGQRANAQAHEQRAKDAALSAIEADPNYAPAHSRFAKLFLATAPNKKIESRVKKAHEIYNQARLADPQRFERNHGQQNTQQQKIIFVMTDEMLAEVCQDRTVLADMKSWPLLNKAQPKVDAQPPKRYNSETEAKQLASFNQQANAKSTAANHPACMFTDKVPQQSKVIVDQATGKRAIRSLAPLSASKA